MGPAGGEWLQIDVPELGGGLVLMRRLDGRFDDLASRQVDYDFDAARGIRTSLTSMVDAVTELTANAGGKHNPVVLKASSGAVRDRRWRRGRRVASPIAVGRRVATRN